MDNIEKWIKFYGSSNEEVRLRAIRNIVNLTDARLAPVLLDAFDKPAFQNYRFPIVKALGRIRNPELFEPLLEFLFHEDFQIVASACEALGYIQDERAIPWLIECLDNPHFIVQFEAATSLSKLEVHDPKFEAGIQKRLEKDQEINIRMRLEPILKRIKEQKSERN